MQPFTYQDKQFMLNNKPFQIISGVIHYFRLMPEQWEDRLLKMKACGLNTVETYIAWNIHEPHEGSFCFEGICDVVRFVKLAEKVGLYVILRPSPYICAEWEFGGMPGWLLSYPKIRLRCFNDTFIEKVENYYNVLMPKLIPLQITKGGPVIAMQVENEYGSFGNDKKYLTALKNMMLNKGVDVQLFTSDGELDLMLNGGTIDEVLKTVNFGGEPDYCFNKLQTFLNEGEPLTCMEFWNGKFDHWEEPHNRVDAQASAKTIDDILKRGASVNIYMFYGGTSFGFYNGANYGVDQGDKYSPHTTSYDFDAPINEAGDLTEKYYLYKKVFEKYTKIEPIEVSDSKKKKYGSFKFTKSAELFSNLDNIATVKTCAHTLTMEELGQEFGFVLYSTNLKAPYERFPLYIQEVRDRACVYADEKYVGSVYRNSPDEQLIMAASIADVKLDILVENMGRINYGPNLKDEKGITEGVRIERQFLHDWTMYSLPLDNTEKLVFEDYKKYNTPAFYKCEFEIDEVADTFISTIGLTKGIIFVNGFNLGRYWEVGPQYTLYIPAPLLKLGLNEIVVFEIHHLKSDRIELTDTPKI